VAEHREPLRAACAEDQDIWDIYPESFLGEEFDRRFAGFFGDPQGIPFSLFHGERLVGMSSFLGIDDANRTLQIGRTYLAPPFRGTGFNRRVKQLMLDRAFASNFRRVEFRVDTRNRRSLAAVAALGAVHEGTLRQDRITWTGYLRDTAIFAILADEWRRAAKADS
jgi:RimJ/RimL family protein N-acetyltransferase